MEARTLICVCKEMVEFLVILTLCMFAGSEKVGGGLFVWQRNALVFASGELTGNFHTREQVIVIGRYLM